MPRYWIAGVHNPTLYHERNLFWRASVDSGLSNPIGPCKVVRRKNYKPLQQPILGLTEIQLSNEAFTWLFHKPHHVTAGQIFGFKGLDGFFRKFQDNEKIKEHIRTLFFIVGDGLFHVG